MDGMVVIDVYGGKRKYKVDNIELYEVKSCGFAQNVDHAKVVMLQNLFFTP